MEQITVIHLSIIKYYSFFISIAIEDCPVVCEYLKVLGNNGILQLGGALGLSHSTQVKMMRLPGILLLAAMAKAVTFPAYIRCAYYPQCMHKGYGSCSQC